MQFCKSYNAATQDKIGTVIPVEITVFDVSHTFSCLIHEIHFTRMQGPSKHYHQMTLEGQFMNGLEIAYAMCAVVHPEPWLAKFSKGVQLDNDCPGNKRARQSVNAAEIRLAMARQAHPQHSLLRI